MKSFWAQFNHDRQHIGQASIADKARVVVKTVGYSGGDLTEFNRAYFKRRTKGQKPTTSATLAPIDAKFARWEKEAKEKLEEMNRRIFNVSI